MRNQYIIIGAGLLCAAIATPIISHRWLSHTIFYVGLTIFIGIPLLAGLMHNQTSTLATILAVVLLGTCPIVYIVCQSGPSQAESLIGGYFLFTGWTLIFVFTSWLSRSFHLRKWGSAAVATFMTMTSGIAVWFVLFMFLIFE